MVFLVIEMEMGEDGGNGNDGECNDSSEGGTNDSRECDDGGIDGAKNNQLG